VAFSARHSSSAGVTRYFHRLGCAFAVRTVGPRARQLAVLVTMLSARFHHFSCYRCCDLARNPSWFFSHPFHQSDIVPSFQGGLVAASRTLVWTGWIISILASLVFLMSGAMKFVGGPQVDEGLKHVEIAKSMVIPLGILELTCIIIYLIPITAVLGAILMTGYVGGVILTHWRVGDPVYVPIVLGLLLWLGLYLREPRLKELIPFRKTPTG